MVIKDFLEAITILSKYVNRGITVGYDMIYIGDNKVKVSNKDKKRLKELGWEFDISDGWRCLCP